MCISFVTVIPRKEVVTEESSEITSLSTTPATEQQGMLVSIIIYFIALS